MRTEAFLRHSGWRDQNWRNARRSTDGASRRWVLIVMSIGYFLGLLDVTTVNVALPRIGSELGTSVNGLQWVLLDVIIGPGCWPQSPSHSSAPATVSDH